MPDAPLGNVVFECGDSLALMKELPDCSVDLVMCSPPYEAARTYGIDFNLKGQDYVDWAVERYVECCRVSKGLVAWVIEGQTRQYCWSATPVLLMADLHRRGVKLRKPPAFHRVGIPGSGGPDWLRNDYEFIVCASHGRLPWSDNTACGHEPRWPVGGEMSNRTVEGKRVNGSRVVRPRSKEGPLLVQGYKPPSLVNPGNVVKCNAGGGVMGSRLCHENEAPYPELLAEFFVKSFCPPGGIVLDPFCGSGTTLAVARRLGRQGIRIDIRQSQIDLSIRRCAEVQPPPVEPGLFAGVESPDGEAVS